MDSGLRKSQCPLMDDCFPSFQIHSCVSNLKFGSFRLAKIMQTKKVYHLYAILNHSVG